ncbi:MAG TPA: hypothetical protein PK961_08680 [bacterium]|nr:hypothetical protein [bacterium]
MKMQWMCAFILMAIGLSFWLACGDDDDDDNDDNDNPDDDADDDVDDGDDDDMSDGDDDEIDPDCIGNTAPDLLGVSFFVNGEAATAPLNLLTTDVLEFAIEYADAECNLNGGGAYVQAMGEGVVEETGWGFDDLGCSSEVAGPHRFYVSPFYFRSADEGPFYLGIVDKCGGESLTLPLDIAAQYVEPDCDDPNPPALLGVTVKINGVETALPAVFHPEDEVVAAIEYDDPNCALNTGSYWIIDSQGVYRHGDEMPGIGCSSAETGPYEFELRCGLLHENNDPPFELKIQGACGYSNSLPLDLRCVE